MLERRQLFIDENFPQFSDSTFENFTAKNKGQIEILDAMKADPSAPYFIHGVQGLGKTHLLIASFKQASEIHQCELRSGWQLMEELRQAETDIAFISGIQLALEKKNLHLFWDDIGKIAFDKTAFRMEVLFELIDEMSRKKLPFTATSNHNFLELQTECRMPAATARRLERMCSVMWVK